MVNRCMSAAIPPFCSGQKQQMPMIGHQAIGANPDRRLVARFAQHELKRLEVRRLLEKLHARDAAIQDMKHHPTRGRPALFWQRGRLIKYLLSCEYRTRFDFRLLSRFPTR